MEEGEEGKERKGTKMSHVREEIDTHFHAIKGTEKRSEARWLPHLGAKSKPTKAVASIHQVTNKPSKKTEREKRKNKMEEVDQ